MIIDTHCHLHDTEFFGDQREAIYQQAIDVGVGMICVGTDVRSSREAVEFCRTHDDTWPIVGIHPHDAATNEVSEIRDLIVKYRGDIVGIGEIGLDYYYDNSPREAQQQRLREQLALAVEFDLPVSFHVRDTTKADEIGVVWRDFWRIYDEAGGVRGVLHSFTDTQANCDEGIRRGLYIGVNGISTFTRDAAQQAMFAALPLGSMVLETDAPFLTPRPFRGKMNVPAYVGRVAEHQAMQKDCSPDDITRATTANARVLFGI